MFRESSCESTAHDPVVLAVWFHLKWLPARARVRQWLFERLSMINTLLFAGFAGFRVKLWMVDHQTSDYAGLYLWNGRSEAEIYGRYITALLRPLSRPGSVGFDILDGQTLDVYFAARHAQDVAA